MSCLFLCQVQKQAVLTTISDMGKNLVMKYKRLAQKATFTNSYIEKALNADEGKSLYENGLTSGTIIDGKCIRVKTIEKYCGKGIMDAFFHALRNGEDYDSPIFDIYGYDGSLQAFHGMGVFNKEYKGCGNGYYYLLINDDNFIGYDND